MATTLFTCYAGDSTDIWEIGYQTSLDGEPLTLAPLDVNYSCQLTVEGTNINRAITTKNVANNRFRAWLTPAETALLTPGKVYTIGIQLRNDTLTPPLLKEAQIRLRMLKGVVA